MYKCRVLLDHLQRPNLKSKPGIKLSPIKNISIKYKTENYSM